MNSTTNAIFLEEDEVLDEEDIITFEKDINEEIIEKDITVTKIEESYRKNLTLKIRITTTETIVERIIKRQITNGAKGKISEDSIDSEESSNKIVDAPRCFVSKGERVITEYLKKHHIKFVPQKRYKNCRFKHPLPFDFYLTDRNLLIEYDGKQHFFIDGRMTKAEDFEKHTQKDMIKLKYAIENNIVLLRISYLETEIIPDILDEVLNEENLDCYQFLYDIKNICNIKVLSHYRKQMEDATKELTAVN